jgi:hypothetical protein
MKVRLLCAFLVGAAVGAFAMPVSAAMCYEVIDRNGVVTYRDTHTPVDLSAAGASAREAMRQRGELLVIYDARTCLVLARTSLTGGKPLSADQIVAEWRPMDGKGGWGTYSSRYGGRPAPVPYEPPTPSGDRPINIGFR